MALKRKYDVPIIIALVLAGLVYASSRTEFHLRTDMPVEFFDASHLPPAKRAAERKVAQKYWNCAVNLVQWKYGYASRLPEDPPAEFSVSASDVGAAANDEALRRQYWSKLRTVWNVPTAWKTEYVWSSVSFQRALRGGGDWWAQMTRGLYGH